jgi:NodT family efflux transporter outer membrane factor (OMF) lipoprotein
MIAAGARGAAIILLGAGLGLALSGCRVGPDYIRPAAPTAPAFKESLPENFKSEDGWKPAQPSDAKLKGDWWTLFSDPQLNTLETQIDPANQTLKQAEANFRAARAAVRFNRASEAPTIGVAPGVGAVRDSNNQPYLNVSGANTGDGNFILPFDLNYEIDLWGRVRRTVTQAREEAQASAADLETSRLSLHAELAVDYFDLRSADAQRKLLDDTVKAFRSALQLTEDRYNGGASPLSDVTQARTQLQAAQVQATDVDIQRASYEHAIAVLVGKAPGEFRPSPECYRHSCWSAVLISLRANAAWRRPTNRSVSLRQPTIQRCRSRQWPASQVHRQSTGFRGRAASSPLVLHFHRPSSIMAAGVPLPTLPSHSMTAPLPLTGRPRSPHSSRLRTT